MPSTYVQTQADDDMVFGTAFLTDTQIINYVGTWKSLPVLIITGPIFTPRIDNLTTGEKLEFSSNIAAGRVVTIDLAYGVKSVTDDLGNNLIGQLTTDSDLATFHIAPDPEAPNGVNQIQIQGGGAVPGETSVELRYFTRYFGI